MLKQEKENKKQVLDKYHKLIEERVRQIEAQKIRNAQLQQDLKDVKAEMKRTHRECKETLLEYHNDIVHKLQNQLQQASATNNEGGSQTHFGQGTHVINLTQGDETIVQDVSALTANLPSMPLAPPSNPTVPLEPVRQVTENVYIKQQNPVKNQQEQKSSQKTPTPPPKFQNNRSDERLPCFLVGKLQEEKMDKFLKRIQINKPAQPKQSEPTSVQRQAPPKEIVAKQDEQLPKPTFNAEIPLVSFQLPENCQDTLVNQSIMNQSSRQIVNQSAVNQSIVDQSLHTDDVPDPVPTHQVQQEDENFGMKSKAEFFEDSDEQEEVSLDSNEPAQHSQNSSENETANEEFREKLEEIFDSDDILRLSKRVLKSDIANLTEFLERNRNELTFTTKRCKASHIALPTSNTEHLIISCLSDQMSSVDDGYERALGAIKSEGFDFERLRFVIE